MKDKVDLSASTDVLDAIAQGKSIDKKFDKMVEKVFRSDIWVRRNIDKVVWNFNKYLKK